MIPKTVVNPINSTNTVVNTASSLVGKVRYSFGADDVPGGVADCSSFTQYVYDQAGIDIGRDTRAQWAKGVEVPKKALQPGDLVFFQGTYRPGVSHVGIYVGDGKMIHNGDSGTQVADINSKYYTEHYLGAKRVINNPTHSIEDYKYNSLGSTNIAVPPNATDDQLAAANEVVNDAVGLDGDLDLMGVIVRIIIIIGVIVLAVVFLLKAFDINPFNLPATALNKLAPSGGD